MDTILTSGILKIIIGCLTGLIALLIIAVIINFWTKRKLELRFYLFVASIFILVAVCIWSYVFRKDNQILDFVSLLSGIVSIILAIVTLIYSFIGNSNAKRQTYDLLRAAKRVERASISYSKSATILQDNIGEIIEKISNVENTTSEISTMLGSTSKQIGNTQKREMSNSMLIKSEDIKKYVFSSTMAGAISLYAAVQSYTYNKSFKLSVLSNRILQNYCLGYVSAVAKTGILKISVDEPDRFNCVGYEKDLDKYVNEFLELNCKNDKNIKIMQKLIDEFFEN